MIVLIFRDGRLGVGVQQLGAVADDPAPTSCAVPGRKPGTSQKVTIGMFERVARVRTNRAPLAEESMSSTPASCDRLVADDPDRVSVKARATPQMMLRA